MRKNSNNTGNDFYQIKEVGSNPAYSNQARALVKDCTENFNPAHVAINLSFMAHLGRQD